MKLLIFIFLISLQAQAATKTPNEPILDDFVITNQPYHKNKYWIGGGILSSVVPGEMIGSSFEFGYLPRLVGSSIRFSFGTTPYSGIQVRPGFEQSSNKGNPGVEVSKNRNEADRWTFFLLEPGFIVQTRLFPRMVPLLSQKMRLGLGYGGFYDQTNNLSYSALLIKPEVGLEYSFDRNSSWAVECAWSWTWGRLMLNKSSGSGQRENGWLPVSFLNSNLFFHYFF